MIRPEKTDKIPGIGEHFVQLLDATKNLYAVFSAGDATGRRESSKYLEQVHAIGLTKNGAAHALILDRASGQLMRASRFGEFRYVNLFFNEELPIAWLRDGKISWETPEP